MHEIMKNYAGMAKSDFSTHSMGNFPSVLHLTSQRIIKLLEQTEGTCVIAFLNNYAPYHATIKGPFKPCDGRISHFENKMESHMVTPLLPEPMHPPRASPCLPSSIVSKRISIGAPVSMFRRTNCRPSVLPCGFVQYS